MRTSRLLAITSSREEGGAESHLRTTLGAVRALGCAVDVALPRSAGTVRLRNDLVTIGCQVRTSRVGAQSVSKVGAYLDFARDLFDTLWAIARVRPDAVLLNLPTPEGSPGAMLACALARVQTTVIFHLVRSDLTVTATRRKLYRRVGRSAQRWVCVSRDNRQKLAEQFGVAPERIAVVRNGVRLSEVPPTARDRTRDDLGVPASATLVLTTGRLGVQKDHNVIVEALANLVALDESLVFVWAGEGPLHGQLSAAVNATGLARHVRLLGRREDVPELLAAADMFLMPSRDEGAPLALAEAMLAGVPAIVSDIGALREIIIDGRSGFAFARGDPDDLVRVVGHALANREKLREMASVAREQAEREFSLERMLEGHLAHVMPRAPSRSRA